MSVLNRFFSKKAQEELNYIKVSKVALSANSSKTITLPTGINIRITIISTDVVTSMWAGRVISNGSVDVIKIGGTGSTDISVTSSNKNSLTFTNNNANSGTAYIEVFDRENIPNYS